MKQLAKKLFSWASITDDATIEQAQTTASMPFIQPHLALMPDAHLGRGSTVGSVIPTKGTIIPAAVGVDIGCGMIAVRTQYTKDDIADVDLSELRKQIEFSIPTGMGRNKRVCRDYTERRIMKLMNVAVDLGVEPESFDKGWELALGTLGGGNHFIEVCLDNEDRVWFFLHSGSRGVGNKMAQKYIQVAEEYCTKHYIQLPNKDLAYLVEGTTEFDEYVRHLRWGQAFAFENRAEMMDRVIDQFQRLTGLPVQRTMEVNTHHNYTEQERHMGHDVWLSRKGAIDAHEGVLGLIPGSMGTKSYVVRGKGNHMALHSAPHGAGRLFSRKKAREQFTIESMEEAMQGIEFRSRDAIVDEHPGAYKAIDVVMEDASDLVEILYELRQIVNIKGD